MSAISPMQGLLASTGLSAPAAPPILRGYQGRLIDAVRAEFLAGYRRVLMVACTGAGKTVMFSWLAGAVVENGKSVLIVAHRRELIRQASEKLTAAGVPHGIIAPGCPATDHKVQVGSVQTLANRLDTLSPFDLIVLDEAHHAVAGQWAQLIASQPTARILGCTATPERLDGRGLGVRAGGVFERMVVGATVAELTALGFLAPAKVLAPPINIDLSRVRSIAGDYDAGQLGEVMDRPEIHGDAVKHYEIHARGLPCIAFCTSVAHAENVAQAFREAGWRSVCAHGGLRTGERDAAIGGLADGTVQVLATCDLISEGLDVPAVGAVILLRPTQSLPLHVQQVGRGLRPAPGKDYLIVLDHAGNTFRHGLPDCAHVWSLDGRKARESEKVAAIWRCPECFAVQPPVRVCRACGFEESPPEIEEQVGSGREVHQVDGQLELVDPERLAALRSINVAEFLRQPGLTRAAVEEMRRARGCKPGWTSYVMRERQQRGAAA